MLIILKKKREKVTLGSNTGLPSGLIVICVYISYKFSSTRWMMWTLTRFYYDMEEYNQIIDRLSRFSIASHDLKRLGNTSLGVTDTSTLHCGNSIVNLLSRH